MLHSFAKHTRSFQHSKTHFTSPRGYFCGPESSARCVSDLNSVLSINGLLRLWIKCALCFRCQFSFISKWTFAALNQVRGVFETSIKTMDQRIINFKCCCRRWYALYIVSDFPNFRFCTSCVCILWSLTAFLFCQRPLRCNVIINRSLRHDKFRTMREVHMHNISSI